MWVSRKKWNAMNARIADLEREVQGQPIKLSEDIKVQLGDSDISNVSDAIAEELKKVVINHFD